MRLRHVVAALATTGVAAAASAAPAAATGYCSPETGDYCYSAVKKAGVVRIGLDTFSFTGKVKTCVTEPGGTKTCKRFTLKTKKSGIYGFSKRWSRYFPNGGKGTYKVTFAPAGMGPLGPGVTFKR